MHLLFLCRQNKKIPEIFKKPCCKTVFSPYRYVEAEKRLPRVASERRFQIISVIVLDKE